MIFLSWQYYAWALGVFDEISFRENFAKLATKRYSYFAKMRDEFCEFRSFAKLLRSRKKRVSRNKKIAKTKKTWSKNKNFTIFLLILVRMAAKVVFGHSKQILWVGLTGSLVLQFFSENFVENETHFSQKYQCKSRESHDSHEKWKMQYIVQFARLANKQNHNS